MTLQTFFEEPLNLFSIPYSPVTFCIPHSVAHHVADLQRLLVVLSVTATVCQWEVSATMAPVWLMCERNSRQFYISVPYYHTVYSLSYSSHSLNHILPTLEHLDSDQLPHPHQPVNIHLKNTHHTHTSIPVHKHERVTERERERGGERRERSKQSGKSI